MYIDPRTVIIEMSQLDCSICGMRNLFYLTSQDEIPQLKCMECQSTIYEIEAWSINESSIDNFRDNSY